jgi:hypothetical protein
MGGVCGMKDENDKQEPARSADDERWAGEDRRKKRSSFVERVGRARARRASDPKKPSTEDEQSQD